MNIRQALARVIDGHHLSHDEMTAVMHTIMGGEATAAQIGALLTGLRMKGETVEEIAAAAEVMRELATAVPMAPERRAELVDTCGTGGDSAGLFNVSTATAFVVAAAGGRVAKHGNRSVSSRTGSADLLEAAGVSLDIDPAGVAHCIDQVGVGFMFAPRYHGAMKHAIGPRREMGVRTLFNLIGPLTNPAVAPNQVLGVFDSVWLEPVALVLHRLGSRHVLVVHSDDGLDEISIAAPTQVAELKDGAVSRFTLEPEAVGLERASLDSLRVDDARASLALIRRAFAGEPGPARDMIAFNAGAALYVAGLVRTIEAGVREAHRVLDNGAAATRLEQLARVTRELASA